MLENQQKRTSTLAPRDVRYIKLGPGNNWFASCKVNNRIEFGHSGIEHQSTLPVDSSVITAAYIGQGRTPSKANDFAREVSDFYNLGSDCLWITFAEGCLWWAFAEPNVEMFKDVSEGMPSRYRRTIAHWSNKDLEGNILSIVSLSSVLTKVAGYRQTLCRVEARKYLLRRINCIDEPQIERTKSLQSELAESASELIRNLHWRDFEVLCDLIFARSGWHRIAELGGSQKDTDLVLEQAVTGERAFVQIKSKSDRATLVDYVTRFERDPSFSRMFYCCHSFSGSLAFESSETVHIWTCGELSRQTIKAGLVDWLITKAS